MMRWILLPTVCLFTMGSFNTTVLAQAPIQAGEFEVGQDDWPWWRGPNRDGSQTGGKGAAQLE